MSKRKQAIIMGVALYLASYPLAFVLSYRDLQDLTFESLFVRASLVWMVFLGMAWAIRKEYARQ